MSDFSGKFMSHFYYDGRFELEFLADDEKVRATGDRSGDCEIVLPSGDTVHVSVGDYVWRASDGSIYTTHTI